MKTAIKWIAAVAAAFAGGVAVSRLTHKKNSKEDSDNNDNVYLCVTTDNKDGAEGEIMDICTRYGLRFAAGSSNGRYILEFGFFSTEQSMEETAYNIFASAEYSHVVNTDLADAEEALYFLNGH